MSVTKKLVSLVLGAVALIAVSPLYLPADTLTVVNTQNEGAGSLRQAILDANTLPGADDIVFDIPGTDPRFNDQWFTIVLISELPALTDDGTRILGFSQAENQGDSNPGLLGTGGTVGVDAVPLPQYDRPEILINAGGFNALTIGPQAADILIEGVGVINAESAILAPGLTSIGTPGTSRVVRSVVLGVFPDGNDPASLRNDINGVRLETSSPGLDPVNLTVERSYVGYSGEVGVLGQAGATVLDISLSEVFENGWSTNAHDGIDVNGESSTVRFNLSRDNRNENGTPNSGSGHGIEAGSQDVAGSGGHVIENNTVVDNLGAGIAVRAGASDCLVSKNVAARNAAGIYVNSEGFGRTAGNHITMNSTFENAGLGIDLHAESGPAAFDGVTLNSLQSGQGGSNLLVAFPVITDASVTDGVLSVAGFSDPNAIIEFFEADFDASGFGEGARFLFLAGEGSSLDLDGSTGSYGPEVQELPVAVAELTTNRFEFTFPVPDGVGDPFLLTATQTVAETGKGALQGQNTSEFSPVISAEDGGFTVDTESDELPEGFRLLGAYPNPFNPSTTIRFALAETAPVVITVYSVTGAEVALLADRQLPAGEHAIQFEAGGLPSGTYLYRIASSGRVLTDKLVLLR